MGVLEMSEVRTLRISNVVVVLDGVNPLQFYYADDPQKQLYQYDEDGNQLYTGINFDEREEK
jgi:hypothetical protein